MMAQAPFWLKGASNFENTSMLYNLTTALWSHDSTGGAKTGV